MGRRGRACVGEGCGCWEFMEVGGMEGMDELGLEGWDNGQEGEESQDDG